MYKLESLTGRTEIVHAARMWPYEGRMFVPKEILKSIYVHDFESLEIDEIKKIKIAKVKKRPKYVAEVKWLGFEESFNSEQDMLYEDVPLMVKQYVLNARVKTPKLERESLKRLLYEWIVKCTRQNSARRKRKSRELRWKM